VDLKQISSVLIFTLFDQHYDRGFRQKALMINTPYLYRHFTINANSETTNSNSSIGPLEFFFLLGQVKSVVFGFLLGNES
jgi:hypothetical protein